MSPERQNILDTIKAGYHTPREIGIRLGKKAQTISKLLYVMNKEGWVKRGDYGRYFVDDIVDSQVQLSMNNLDSIDKLSMEHSIIKSLIAEQVRKEVEHYFKKEPVENLPTKIDELEGENERLREQTPELENDKVDLIKLHALNREQLIHQYEELIEALQNERDGLQVQLDSVRAELEDLRAKTSGGSKGEALINQVRENAKQAELDGKTTVRLPNGKGISLRYVEQFCEVIRLVGMDETQSRAVIHGLLVDKFKGQDLVSVRQISDWKRWIGELLGGV